MMDPSLEVRQKHFAEISEATLEGAKRRARFQTAVEASAHEFHGVGIEMNRRYESSAVYLSDEKPRPALPEDAFLNMRP